MEPKAMASVAGVSVDDVVAGLKNLLPFAELIAKATANKVDDAAVAFLKTLLDQLGS